MPDFAEPLARLITEFKRLPGIGQKSAQRLAFHVLRASRERSWLGRMKTKTLISAAALRRVMKPDASFFLNISGSSSRPWLPFELIVRLRPLFVLQNQPPVVPSLPE